jgi:hypothetical protein
MGKLLADGKLKPNPVRKLGGLDKVDEGFELAQNGKVIQLDAYLMARFELQNLSTHFRAEQLRSIEIHQKDLDLK